MYKFKTTFSSILKPITQSNKDEYLSLASREQLQRFIPGIDVDSLDLLAVAFDACVVNRVNKNGDVITTNVAMDLYKNFINKPINLDHNRQNVVGFITNASFSEFGTNEPLSEIAISEMIKDNRRDPFYITLGGVLWRIVNRDFVDDVEDSNDPSSDNYMGISASWELGFSEYNIAVTDSGNKNINMAEFITDMEAVEKYKSHLKAYGGNGQLDKNKDIHRNIIGNDILALGIGLTKTPAADVKGIATMNKSNESEIIVLKKASDDMDDDDSMQKNDIKTAEKDKNCSHSNKNTVIENKSMKKIKDIKDITDEFLKEAQASTIHEFIESKLREASEDFSTKAKAESEKVEKLENDYKTLSQANKELTDSNKTLTEANESLVKEKEGLEVKLQEVNTKLEEIQAKQAQAEKVKLFNDRMASLDETFDLNDKTREVIAADIKDLDEDGFTQYKNKLDVLFEGRKAEKEDKEDKEVLANAMKDSKKEEVVASAKNAKTDKSEDFVTKYKEAFSSEGFVVKIRNK